jgi:hypothetical protein
LHQQEGLINERSAQDPAGNSAVSGRGCRLRQTRPTTAAEQCPAPVQPAKADPANNVALPHTLDGGKTWSIQFP